MRRIAIAVGVLCGVCALAQYPGMRALTGEFDVTGRTPVDPPPSERRDTHFRVHLTGEAAKVLFEQMEVDAGPLKCDARPGHREKRIGSMLCSTDGENYECFFAIDVEKQLIDGGWAC
jgi:hypothetical protein